MTPDLFAFLWDMSVFVLAAAISVGVLLSNEGTPPEGDA